MSRFNVRDNIRALAQQALAPAPTRADAAPAAQPTPAAPAEAQLERRTDSMLNSLTGMGGENDSGASSWPNTSRRGLNRGELTALWLRTGIARRIVEVIPADATRKGWRIEEGSDQVDPMREVDRDLSIVERTAEAFTWARLYGGGALLMVTNDSAGDLSQPLDLGGIRSLTNIVVMERAEYTPVDYDPDLNSPNFGKPLHYSITFTVSANVTDGSRRLQGLSRVHWTRVITFPGAKLPPTIKALNNGFDDSILNPIWDQVRNLTTIEQGAATLTQHLKTDVLKSPNIIGRSLGDTAAAFDLRMSALAKGRSLLNILLLDANEEFETRNTSATGYKDLAEGARIGLAAVSGLPASKLFGEAPGGLNSDGASHLSLMAIITVAVQELILRPRLERLYTVAMSAKDGPFNGKLPKTWRLVFNPLSELTATEEAALRKTYAEIDQLNIMAQVYTPEDVAASRYGEAGWQAEMLSVDLDERESNAALVNLQQQEGEEGDPSAAEPPDGEAAPVEPRPEAKAFLVGDKTTVTELLKALNKGDLTREQVLAELVIMVGVTEAEAIKLIATPTKPPERSDADFAGKALISVQLSATGLESWKQLLAKVETITGPLEGAAPGERGLQEDPHATVLFMGEVPPGSLSEVGRITREVLQDQGPLKLVVGGVEAFPSSPDGRTPIVAGLLSWNLCDMNEQLLRRLAHLVQAQQFPSYRGHVTLGYAPALSAEQRAGLAEMVGDPWSDDAVSLGAVTEVLLRMGGEVVARVPLLGERVDTVPAKSDTD